jgi:hypothetical protein
MAETATNTELLAACNEALARIEDARKAVEAVAVVPTYVAGSTGARDWDNSHGALSHLSLARELVRSIQRRHQRAES